MTTYNRSDRRHWRCHLRRVVWRINYLLILCLVWLALLAQTVQAAPRCPGGGQPDGRGRCAYRQPSMTCAWPARIVRIGQVAVCWRPAPEVQP